MKPIWLAGAMGLAIAGAANGQRAAAPPPPPPPALNGGPFPFLFDPQSAALGGQSLAEARTVVVEANRWGEPVVVIVRGHADQAEAAAGAGERISRERARVVAARLRAGGLAARHRLRAAGYGAAQLKVIMPAGVEHGLNRRVEVTFEPLRPM